MEQVRENRRKVRKDNESENVRTGSIKENRKKEFICKAD